MNDIANKPTITAEMQQTLSRAEKALAFAQGLTIVDADSYTQGGKAINQCKGVWDDIEAGRVSLVKPLNDHVKFLNGLAKPKQELVKKAERILTDKRSKYRHVEEVARMEAERVRAQKQAEIEAKAAEDAAAAGSPEEAQAIKTKALMETPAPVASTIPQDDGMVIAESWAGVCDSVTSLAASVAITPSNASFLLINQSMLNSRAREMGKQFSLPGCRAVKVETEKRGKR